MYTLSRHLVSGLVSVLLVGLSTSVAHAQATPTEAQVQHLRDGAAAAAGNDLDHAIREFEAALAEGAFNVIYLNLGRALYKAGRCREAADAFDRVETSPPVEAPPPAAVKEALGRYRADIAETCQGEVVVVCHDPRIEIRVDGGAPVLCEVGSLWLPPGSHALTASLGQRAESLTVAVKALERREVRFDLRRPDAQTSAVPGSEEPPIEPLVVPDRSEVTESQILGWTGWAVMGTGIAMLGGTVIYDQVSAQPRVKEFEQAGESGDAAAFDALRQELDTAKALEQAGLLMGGSLVALGSSLIIYAWLSNDEAMSAVSVLAGSDRLGASVEVHW